MALARLWPPQATIRGELPAKLSCPADWHILSAMLRQRAAQRPAFTATPLDLAPADEAARRAKGRSEARTSSPDCKGTVPVLDPLAVLLTLAVTRSPLRGS
jgi:hypothetical protein